MLRIGTFFFSSTLVLTLAASPTLAWQGEEKWPPHEGRSGISFWPDNEDGGDPKEARNLATCEVHYVLKESPDQESIYPCGTKFWPEPGRFFAWLENKGTMSAFTNHGQYG